MPTSADDLLRSLGDPTAPATITAYCARGPEAIDELFTALVDPSTPPNPRDGRAVFEDEEQCLVALARAHPRRFLTALDAHPALADRFAVISALAAIPDPAAEDRLLTALAHRSGGHRWLALTGLLARDSDRVVPHLQGLLRDRDGTVGFIAVDGLRRRGTARDIPALLKYCKTAAIGGREFALDAIESICARERVPLPAAHPGPRLELVTAVGERIDLHVIVASRVRPGDLLAHVDGAPLRAPCAGVVSAIEHPPLRLQIRREGPPPGSHPPA